MNTSVTDEMHSEGARLLEGAPTSFGDDGPSGPAPEDFDERDDTDSTASDAANEEFDFEEFMAWLGQLAARIGKTLMEKALVAFYVARDPETPGWAQASLIGALVYLGLPIDFVPDPIPFAGLGDDAAVLALALAAVVTSIRVRHIREARGTMRTWGVNTDDPDPNLDDDDTAPSF